MQRNERSNVGVAIIAANGTLESVDPVAKALLDRAGPGGIERLLAGAAGSDDSGLHLEDGTLLTVESRQLDRPAGGWICLLHDAPPPTAAAAALEMAALRSLFAGVEHGLRGPLNGMVLHLELLRLASPSDPHVEAIDAEIKRLTGMLEALLEVLGSLPEGDGREGTAELGAALESVGRLLMLQARQRRVDLQFASDFRRPLHLAVAPRTAQALLLIAGASELGRVSEDSQLTLTARRAGDVAVVEWAATQVEGRNSEVVLAALSKLAANAGGEAQASGSDRLLRLELPVA